MCDSSSKFTKFAENAIAALFAVAILILVFYGLFYALGLAEKLDNNHIYTAGATMRVLGQQFSSTDQGTSDLTYNDLTNDWNKYSSSERFSIYPFGAKKKKSESFYPLKKNVKY